ncbi:TonB-dependent receptor plug domain-containing protein, partial [Sphingobium sp. LMA1-1-1.1]|uniref:TonB-dependent receptor plug domain-containing protein n=1 Tax=Sphingobium sp. LMA1-1-1.1 TaxID=3135238 RepID=UPI003435A042
TPGVHVSGNFGGQTAQYTIRGVTQNDFSDVLEGPVAVYFDDGYIGSLSGQIFGTFDLERVEILKGPQGTLFGRNATGGLVHFIPRKPTDQLSINANATYGRFNQTRLEAGIGGPLGNGFSGRATVLYNRQDPIFKNIYPVGNSAPGPVPARCCENTWNDNTLGGRL